MRFVLHYIAEYKWYAILAPLFKMLEAIFELLVPLVVAAMIDRGIDGGDRSYVVRMGLVLLGLAIVGMAVSVTAQFFAASAAVLSAGRMRSDVFRRILSFSDRSYDMVGTSALLTRITSDLNQVQGGINMTLRLFLRSPFVVIGAMIMAGTISIGAMGLFAAVILVLSLFIAWLMHKTLPLYGEVQSRLEGLLLLVSENLKGIRVIRAFVRGQQERENFLKQNKKLCEKALLAGNWQSCLNPVTFVIINLAVVVLLTASGRSVNAGSLTTGETVALYNYMCQILVELVKFASLVVQITRAKACADRVSKLMEMQPDERRYPAGEKEDALERESNIAIEFLNVAFSYPESSSALSDISFKVRAGETAGIIGGTGSGKSTIGHLMRHAYDAESGRVCLFGRDAADYFDEEIGRIVACVPQQAHLFAGTVEDNLKLGNPNASDETLKDALVTAMAYDFVKEKGGLSAEVKKGGVNFSGGQRQRLCIARAIAAQSEILILDDATSALDASTERMLLERLKSKKDLTVIIMAQRTASVQQADNVILLDGGWCIGTGTHDELLSNNSIYREIYETGQ